ncbi:SRPBCC domain-containing protein [Pseudaestuariivita atlantica]|uniref:Activator of Hsp90 ATPase homologue 1/2-like C-terminal domain-containing protein n=1 Tax=Pseudaestuariivita atlantica TaxID=1317121 RepID=A0A0L1JT83_9RHOB|nr:SRPBCC domain-containing protein [Pseudaestuariivita atlantica]KNG94922.1 hypothetical protein ATO11_06030 [Pseudaestuariivita atlantica]
MTITTGTLRFERSFNLSPDRLWHLVTDAKEREKWSTPDEDHTLVAEKIDLREGGHEHHRCGPADEPMYTVDTRWYHLNAPASACFTETLNFGGMSGSVSLVTYLLTATGTGTDLTIDVAITSLDDEAPISEHEAGWAGAIDRLTRLAKS